MKRYYKKYGDLVTFGINYGLLKNLTSSSLKYNVGVFTVEDTNLRVLFAGLAIMTKEDSHFMCKVFESFIRIHDKSPQTFITDEQNTIATALSALAERGIFKGAHLLNPFHILKNLRKELRRLNNPNPHKLVKLTRDVMFTRNKREYEKKLL